MLGWFSEKKDAWKQYGEVSLRKSRNGSDTLVQFVAIHSAAAPRSPTRESQGTRVAKLAAHRWYPKGTHVEPNTVHPNF